MTDRDIIKHYLPEAEIRWQMAEETAELFKALSKWRRAHNNVPGWQVSQDDALKSITEELADVLLCAELLDIKPAETSMPDWVESAMEFTDGLLWAVGHQEPSVTTESVTLGKVVAWAKIQGITEEQIEAVMDAKAARWRERLEESDA